MEEVFERLFERIFVVPFIFLDSYFIVAGNVTNGKLLS